ncbi:MAG: nitric oxide reductase, partial [Sedimenticola sp.]|nr:nitric oxide reductase [Sedimenticola sp.]
MEEKVGEIWHRMITRMAETRYPDAAVHLEEIELTMGIMFRALGGDGGLEVAAANATEHGARRGLLQRIAGNNKRIELAWRDDQSLRLPATIDYFPEQQLNHYLYTWLAALAVGDHQEEEAW